MHIDLEERMNDEYCSPIVFELLMMLAAIKLTEPKSQRLKNKMMGISMTAVSQKIWLERRRPALRYWQTGICWERRNVERYESRLTVSAVLQMGSSGRECELCGVYPLQFIVNAIEMSYLRKRNKKCSVHCTSVVLCAWSSTNDSANRSRASSMDVPGERASWPFVS